MSFYLLFILISLLIGPLHHSAGLEQGMSFVRLTSGDVGMFAGLLHCSDVLLEHSSKSR